MPSKNTSFSVGKHFSDFIETQITAGRFASASDVIRAGLRLLEEREAHLAALRAEIIKGEESGISPRKVDDIWESVKRNARPKAANG